MNEQCDRQGSSRVMSRMDPHPSCAPNGRPRIVIQRTVAPKSRSLLDLWDPSRQSPPGSSPQPRLLPLSAGFSLDRNPLLRLIGVSSIVLTEPTSRSKLSRPKLKPAPPASHQPNSEPNMLPATSSAASLATRQLVLARTSPILRTATVANQLMLARARGYATPSGPPPKGFRLPPPTEWDQEKEGTYTKAGKYFLLTEMFRGMYVLLEQFFRPP